MSKSVYICMIVACVFVLYGSVCRADAEGKPGDKEPAEKGERSAEDGSRIIDAGKPEDVPAKFRRKLEPFFKELPEDHKLRVKISPVYAVSYTELYEYVESCVPVDEEVRPNGIEHRWRPFEGGGPRHHIPWKHGVKDGLERVVARHKRKVFNEMEIPWKDGKVHGMKKLYHKNTKLRSETEYVDGRPHGKIRTFDDEGRLLREGEMKKGKRDGKLIDYWPETGKPKRVIPYDMGRVDGVAKEWYANGELKRIIPFKENAMHGTEKQFEADGTVARIREWKEGELVSETVPEAQ